MVRFHPLALVTFACLVLTFSSALQIPKPLHWVHVVAISCLVSPLMLLLWAHAYLASNWRQQLWLAFCAIPISFLSSIAAFLMGWLQAGWFGVVVFTVSLLGLALASVLPLRRKKAVQGAA
jgi:hypothetical protein